MTIEENIGGKSSALLGLFGRLRAELRSNRRAALGLVVLGFLVLCYGVMRLDDGVALRHQQIVEETHRLERLGASGQDKEWPARAASTSALRKSLEERLWSGDSEGIVQADLQDWVINQARGAGLQRVQVSLEMNKPKDWPGNVRQIIATMRALDTESALTEFLNRITREPRLLVVDHLKVQQQPVHSMEMKLIAYAVVKTDGQVTK